MQVLGPNVLEYRCSNQGPLQVQEEPGERPTAQLGKANSTQPTPNLLAVTAESSAPVASPFEATAGANGSVRSSPGKPSPNKEVELPRWLQEHERPGALTPMEVELDALSASSFACCFLANHFLTFNSSSIK